MTISIYLAGLIIVGVLILGYVLGGANSRWRVYQAERAEARATKEAARLKRSRLQSQDDEFAPLWDAYLQAAEGARKAFEAACTNPPYIVHQKVDEGYPAYGVKVRRVSLDAAYQKTEHACDEDGRSRYYILNAPPPEHTFVVDYVQPMPAIDFPTAQDAERWLEAALNPETVSWGFNAKGRPLGPVDRALLPAPMLTIPR